MQQLTIFVKKKFFLHFMFQKELIFFLEKSLLNISHIQHYFTSVFLSSDSIFNAFAPHVLTFNDKIFQCQFPKASTTHSDV